MSDSPSRAYATLWLTFFAFTAFTHMGKWCSMRRWEVGQSKPTCSEVVGSGMDAKVSLRKTFTHKQLPVSRLSASVKE